MKTDSSWMATWTTTWDTSDDLVCESSARFTDPATPPGLAKLPTREKPAKWVRSYKGNHVIADFGEETFGYLRLLDVKGHGKVKIIYAESESEMYACGVGLKHKEQLLRFVMPRARSSCWIVKVIGNGVCLLNPRDLRS